ncbi:hypothetical protein [Streptomyces sp. NPDC004629]|uniref:hypothetical protein n=1 Tax=Streptomyces sp. NPDC004629 TaxID=3364705 RepID=UPI0036C23489
MRTPTSAAATVAATGMALAVVTPATARETLAPRTVESSAEFETVTAAGQRLCKNTADTSSCAPWTNSTWWPIDQT